MPLLFPLSAGAAPWHAVSARVGNATAADGALAKTIAHRPAVRQDFAWCLRRQKVRVGASVIRLRDRRGRRCKARLESEN
ncbi:hypothetical protein [Dentiradicibacter hellwigii]|uniref:Uncharacterized protein n=1 Tax=Dentiradicibacter hellwigii TaxID=3149053 RepID=A0ABV4UHR2_9RHOO